MSDVPVEGLALPEDVYRPFPSFTDFVRSADADLTTVDRFVAILDEAKATGDPARLREAVERATRQAAIDTGAIEGLYEVDRGFTVSVAASAAAWESMHLAGATDAMVRSINDALEAYQLVLDATTEARPVTESWIRQLHEVVCRSQDAYAVVTEVGRQEQPLPKGVYKTHPNNPFNLSAQRVHAYAAPIDTPMEMARLVRSWQATRSPQPTPSCRRPTPTTPSCASTRSLMAMAGSAAPSPRPTCIGLPVCRW